MLAFLRFVSVFGALLVFFFGLGFAGVSLFCCACVPLFWTLRLLSW